MPPEPLAVSLGGPAGVGPQLICEARARREDELLPPFFVFGGAELLQRAGEARELDVAIKPVANVAEAAANFASSLPFLGDFHRGVNVTLGLPIVHTSPDHCSALGVAGKGIADPDAMIAAISMAGEIAARRAAA